MASLKLSWLELPSADLGSENPHASLEQSFVPIATFQGQEFNGDHAMPYQMIDGYDRQLKPRQHRVAILESDRLRATFLLDLGARLLSLVHKPSEKELLYVNPVFQPANFGTRNAWFSGGIEWNIGVFGHSVFTCSPVFAALTQAPDGTDGLRIWEFERKRGVVWQVDFFAPEGSDFLFWSPRITNHYDKTIPMYWWSCIAVPEKADGRVLAPAVTAIEPDHAMGALSVVHDLCVETDLTYPQMRDLPNDTYFEIPRSEQPWVAYASADGDAVVHLSSPMLCGRKQWVWGMEHCGRRWQDWLSPNGPPYIEIQGGLATKQSDYVPMPAGADWSWLEAIGPITDTDPKVWLTGIECVKNQVEIKLPAPEFKRTEELLRSSSLLPPVETVHFGSGWGALEVERRTSLSLGSLCGSETPFPLESIGSAQRPWIQLLRGESLPDLDPSQPPGGYVGPEWLTPLETTGPNSWNTGLHLGFVYFQSGDPVKARECWEQILPNAWAYRNLAILDQQDGNMAGACNHILKAHRLSPQDVSILDQCCRMYFQAGNLESLESMIVELPTELRSRPRVRLAEAQIAGIHGRLDVVADYFRTPCDLVDIREAETTISDLWRSLCEGDPSQGNPAFPPSEWDFRMKH